MSLLDVDIALARILALVPPVAAETVPLSEAANRVLAAPVVATRDQPPFPASAMDGYAVRTADIVPGRPLPVIGTSQAGARFDGALPENAVVRIFTGAPVPEGADAVIMQEEATREGDRVSFEKTPPIGRSIRAQGHDFAAATPLLEAGLALTPARLALAAATNAGTVTVARRPRIAILATGDELVVPGAALGPDQIVASNSVGLAALLAPYAESVTDHGIARDTAADLDRALGDIFSVGCDVLITTGGASVGDHDLVQPALVAKGVEIDFWRINMRPGKPLMVGRRGTTLVFGLPGNPVSALVTAAVFIRPALRAANGLVPAIAPPFRLPLAAAIGHGGPRRHFMRGRLVMTPDGPAATPIAETDSGHLSSLAAADLLIVQPENDPGQATGTVVECIALHGV